MLWLLSAGTLGVPKVLAYGDASFSATGRGRKSAPTTKWYEYSVHAARSVVRKGVPCHVVPVEEFGTSKFATDSTLMQRVFVRNGVSKRDQRRAAAAQAKAAERGEQPRAVAEWRELRALRYIGSPSYAEPHRRLVDRDKEASCSIGAGALERAFGRPLPAHMQREGYAKPPALLPFFLLPALA